MSSAMTEADWTYTVADAIDGAVATVRDKTVVPVQRVVKMVVGGLLAGSLLATAGILAAIGAYRALDVYLPGNAWSAHLVLGGIFTGAGMFCWSRR
jgi:hypothetical protein